MTLVDEIKGFGASYQRIDFQDPSEQNILKIKFKKKLNQVEKLAEASISNWIKNKFSKVNKQILIFQYLKMIKNEKKLN